ncbi:MAG TPA: cytochrome c3 family protein [Phycisphaerae bacterium]|nr:cytochrome c3 family protein [Phycisphaerae bacterium]
MANRDSLRSTRSFRVWLLVGCAAVGVSIVAASCTPKPQTRAGWPPSLGPVPTLPRKAADNQACLVCHMDFKKEEITVEHAKVGVGCFTCHGPSAAHGDDEANIVTPDVTFGRAEITPFCKTCHGTHETAPKYKAFVKTWTGKRRPNGRMVSAESVCTDCHGNHAVLRPDQLEHLPPKPGTGQFGLDTVFP